MPQTLPRGERGARGIGSRGRADPRAATRSRLRRGWRAWGARPLEPRGKGGTPVPKRGACAPTNRLADLMIRTNARTACGPGLTWRLVQGGAQLASTALDGCRAHGSAAVGMGQPCPFAARAGRARLCILPCSMYAVRESREGPCGFLFLAAVFCRFPRAGMPASSRAYAYLLLVDICS